MQRSTHLLSFTVSSDHGAGRSGVLNPSPHHPPPPPLPLLSFLSCPDFSLISSVRSTDSRGLGPFPWPCPSAPRGIPPNEAVWGTDAERAAWAKTTCHSHLMITHMVMSYTEALLFVCVWLHTQWRNHICVGFSLLLMCAKNIYLSHSELCFFGDSCISFIYRSAFARHFHFISHVSVLVWTFFARTLMCTLVNSCTILEWKK